VGQQKEVKGRSDKKIAKYVFVTHPMQPCGGHLISHTESMISQLDLFANQPRQQPSELRLAIRAGNVPLVRKLLAGGALAQESSPAPSAGTALGMAVNIRSPALVEALLKAGADPNESEAPFRRTPLNSAVMPKASSDDLKIMKLLLKYGAELDKSDDRQRTPLHVAIIHSNWDGAGLLLKWGARIKICDAYDETAVGAAFRIGGAERGQWLEREWAKYEYGVLEEGVSSGTIKPTMRL
jgi:ankyrin repeat protein